MIMYPATIGDLPTRVLEAGEGDRTMLLVHGLGARADRWRSNLDPLADAGYHVYAFDLPGHGFAAKGPGRRYSVPAFAEVVEGFLDSIGAERAILIGTSLGGHTVGWFSCQHPERVTALIMVGSTGLVPLGPERRAQTRGRVTATDPAGVATKLSRVVFDQSLVTPAWIKEESRINSSPGANESFTAIGDYFGESLDDDIVTGRLAALLDDGAFPLLLLWGAQDIGFPVEMGHAAYEQLRGSALVVLEHAAHAPYFERPEAFNKVVLDFLSGHLGEWEKPDVTYRQPVSGD